MKRLLTACVAWLLVASTAFGQGVPYFPQTLPASTVVGRLSTGAGPTEAIPFSVFAQALFNAFAPVSGPNGGTGQTTAVIGDILYASAATPVWSRLADVQTGSVLVSGGVGVAPAWSSSPTLGKSGTTTGTLSFAGSTSGVTVITPAVAASGTLTLPATTDTLAVLGPQTFTGAQTFSSTAVHTGAVTFNGGTTFAAGTTAIAPIVLTSGTNLTTPAAGAIEFDGTAFYLTAAASSRQFVPASQGCLLTADYTLTDSATAQKAFNCSTAGSLTVAAATTYMFEAVYLITNTGTTSHTWSTLFAGTATFTSLNYTVLVDADTTAALGSGFPQMAYTTAATALVVTAASTSATENVIIHLRGIMRINAGGTFIPQVKLSAQANGTEKMLANSFIRLWPVGSNTVATVGNWN